MLQSNFKIIIYERDQITTKKSFSTKISTCPIYFCQCYGGNAFGWNSLNSHWAFTGS